MLTIAVLNQKGGVGKSTLSTNLAAAAHLGGKRTIILDLDRQGSSFDWFSARGEGSKLDGLTVARADKALSLPKFRDLSRGYDVVICDGPPRLSEITQAAAVAADVILIPIRPGAFDWWASSETLDLLDRADEIRQELNRPKARRVFVVNGGVASAHGTKLAVEAVAGVAEVSPVVIHNRVAFWEAASSGESVLTRAPESAAADEIRELFKSLSEASA